MKKHGKLRLALSIYTYNICYHNKNIRTNVKVCKNCSVYETENGGNDINKAKEFGRFFLDFVDVTVDRIVHLVYFWDL